MPNWLNLSLNIFTYLIMAVGLVGMVIPIYPGVVIIWWHRHMMVHYIW